MSNFDPNAILRGAQLTLVGAYRALQNPKLFSNAHYKQAAIAVASGFAIRLIISAPLIGVRFLLWILGFVVDLRTQNYDVAVTSGLSFIENSVLQLPLFLMTAMRHLTPAMDEMFMTSLEWVDHTYLAKHRSDDPSKLRALYSPNLQQYKPNAPIPGAALKEKKPAYEVIYAYAKRYVTRAGISLAIYFLSFMPYIGRFVLPAASFYTFNQAVGPLPAVAVFGLGLFLPRRWIVIFLQGFFSSRTLMRELLNPYFSRIRFSKEQKKQWFRDRQGLLFGFGVGFYLILKIPMLGVLIYGIAEASTAYLVTKITDPPPPPQESEGFAETQIRWKNQHEILKLNLDELIKHDAHVDTKAHSN